MAVNRRTGGLEREPMEVGTYTEVNRRTGGLET